MISTHRNREERPRALQSALCYGPEITASGRPRSPTLAVIYILLHTFGHLSCDLSISAEIHTRAFTKTLATIRRLFDSDMQYSFSQSVHAYISVIHDRKS